MSPSSTTYIVLHQSTTTAILHSLLLSLTKSLQNMDNQQNPFLSWPYFFQGKTMEELSQSLLLTTLELENTRVRAEEELKMRDDQLVELRNLLEKTIRDRDEAQEKCEKLLLDQLLLQQQQQQQQQIQLQKFHCKNQIAPHSGISSIEDDTKNANFSSSDCEESIVSSPILEVIQEKDQDFYSSLTIDKPLPEKGKLLEAVMKAGPLLQTLLVAGPLPNWRHPPPPLETYQIPIPPVIVQPPPPPAPQQFQLPHQDSLMDITTFSNINNFGRVNKKREFCDVTDYSIETMYQKKRLSLIS